MRKLMALATGIVLSVLLVATVNAGPNHASGTPQKMRVEQGKRSANQAPKKAVLSKRNQAKIEVEEMKKIRQQAQTDGTN